MRSERAVRGSRATLVVFALLWSVAGRARAQEPADSGVRGPRLFETNDPLELRLVADFGALGKDRGTTKKVHPAVLSYVGTGGDTVALNVQLETRGHFRLRTCQYPPLKFTFPKDSTGHTIFSHQKSLKFVVQCRGGQTWTNYVLEEYLIYRSYNLLTDRSFRARLVRMTYVDPNKKNAEPDTRYGFFIEDDDRMARRIHGDVWNQQGVIQQQTDFAQMGLLGTFEYLIGNTDWSVAGLHNIVLVKDSASNVYPVPYDFDWSGVISPPYAVPDSRLGIVSVRQRLFRLACRTAEEFVPIFARFNAQKDSIYALYRTQADLEPKRVKQALDYYDEFYRTIADPRAVKRDMMVTCQ